MVRRSPRVRSPTGPTAAQPSPGEPAAVTPASVERNELVREAGGTWRVTFGGTVQAVHVAVGKVVAEKAAGRHEGGSVDLIWINGENFASMKRQELLFSPGWAESLPNWGYVDVENKPTIRTDFTVPVEGLESPWGMAKLVFFHDGARTDAAEMPKSADELLAWAQANTGRFSYPQLPDFMGSTFLKQVLSEKIAEARDIR
jgi:putative thiamine transport system substrate-binding protein